ncbi:hypothetical protein J6590_003202 [Homalodisca vitripennis]|nr:hypothetical protein J6590_003202 [Homalodisca vitripennis]
MIQCGSSDHHKPLNGSRLNAFHTLLPSSSTGYASYQSPTYLFYIRDELCLYVEQNLAVREPQISLLSEFFERPYRCDKMVDGVGGGDRHIWVSSIFFGYHML